MPFVRFTVCGPALRAEQFGPLQKGARELMGSPYPATQTHAAARRSTLIFTKYPRSIQSQTRTRGRTQA
jgi:hypothetical protein